MVSREDLDFCENFENVIFVFQKWGEFELGKK